jgi:UPF0176 protein
MSLPITNIAAYHFTSLNDLPLWRERIFNKTDELELKGTVLLAHEGINLFLAGHRERVDAFLTWLRGCVPFAAIKVKFSDSEAVPFKRLKVKVKNEIIRMNHPAIHPAEGRAPAVDPVTARRWIEMGCDDEGRALLMLDTRNDFEVQAGTFKDALNWHIDRFTQFPEAVQQHLDELQGKTVISFCTGGIRCEKAAIYMREAGVKNIYQLDGGILQYFEDTDGYGFEGNCFVFDERETLDIELTEKHLTKNA